MAKKSIKDQLMEAGFRSNKMENHRTSAKGREVKQAEKHQVTRNFCEHCSLIHPDVERYKHNMPTTEAEWICSVCADKLMIDDRFRVTQQSDMAKKGMFRRYYGVTRDLTKEEGQHSRGPRRDNDGNRSGNRRPDGPRSNSNHRDQRNFKNDRNDRQGGRNNDRPRRPNQGRNGNGGNSGGHGNRDENGDINGNR